MISLKHSVKRQVNQPDWQACQFGVFDAPEPWGPWTTAFYTENWDVGVGETGSFPPKWMSTDGKTVHLVFAGDDAFSVRKATLTASATEDTTPPAPPTGLRVLP